MINRDISFYFLCESGIMKAVVKSRNFIGFLYIFFGFFLTSAGYISWLYHLMEVETAWDLDVISTVIAYLFQAVGIGIYTLLVRLRPGFVSRKIFVIPLYVFYVFFLVPSMFAPSLTGTFLFGFIANLLCGMIASGYLHSLSYLVDYGRRGIVFGAGYSLASIVVWLVSLIGNGQFLKTSFALLLYGLIAAILIVFANRCAKAIFKDLTDESEAGEDTNTSENGKRLSIAILFVSCAGIFLISAIKEMGFYFPAADLISGISIESSRLFYAAGLLLAGLVNDRNRRYGMISVLATTILPFIMLMMARENVSRTILWALDYFFFGFFAVYRVLVFADMCKLEKGKKGTIPYGAGILFGFGLMFGRLGDAVGTQVGIAFGENYVGLVIVAAICFVGIVILFLRMYQYFYASSLKAVLVSVQDKGSKPTFEEFSAKYELSMREREVLSRILNGMSNPEIAQDLYVSESTVKFHIHNLLKKTECKSRVELLDKFHVG
jgi:DNA-binding CsgD family transcriptional regulator